jgi:hypothetical protein
MANVVFHIGAHKTGTTYLQSLFHLNRDRLAQDGIHYPYIGPNNAHHVLAAVWQTMPDVPKAFFNAKTPEDLWQDLIERYADAPGTLFLSAENFSRFYPEPVDMAALAERLSSFEDVKIIYTMRAQAELIQSLWLQLAKSGQPQAIYAYLRKTLEQRRSFGIRIDHNAIYDTLLQGFAPSQIHLLDYDQIRRAPGGIGGSFLDLLGSSLTVDMLDAPPPDEANISPDPLAYWVACQIVRHGAPPAHLVHAATDILSAQGGPTSLLARHEYAKFSTRYAPANALLAERVQEWQPGFTFQEPGIPDDMLYREEISQTQWIDLAAAAYALDSTAAASAERGSRIHKTLKWFKSNGA